MDMFDMGDKFLMLGGHHCTTFFVIREPRFVVLFLHKTKKVPELLTIFQKARARAGHHPDILISDGAGEYSSPALSSYLLQNNIDHHLSNAEE